VTVEPVERRGELAYRFIAQLPDKATHENLAPAAAKARLEALLGDYGQGLLQAADADWQVLGETVLRRPPSRTAAPREHDRRKMSRHCRHISVTVHAYASDMAARIKVLVCKYGSRRRYAASDVGAVSMVTL
jgi:hypothetical protein